MEKKSSNGNGFSGEKKQLESSEIICDNDDKAVGHFYERINKLNESSGLSLVFNFRETMVDLHLLYNEVIKKGGFYQVTKIGKWDEVASASNLKSNVFTSAAQLQKVYETLLLQYELMYSRHLPEESNTWPDKSSLGFSCCVVSSTGKRKHSESSSPLSTVTFGDPDGPTNESKSSNDTCQVATGAKKVHQNTTMTTPSNSNINVVKDPNAPMKPRTGYQIFLRLETHRLKMIHGKSSTSHNLRDMATEAWRSLSDNDKKPYIEAGITDKDRYDREMASYKQRENNQNTKGQNLFGNQTSTINLSTSSKVDDVYHVSLEPDCEKFLKPDESLVELAIEAMKNAETNDPLFHIDWDSSSMDMPY
ncbi:hypothetical protein BUALT_Bualt15G0111800 [Buddleja alternifolia]|uniref:Uncharacterized protein n=1 Tax=Buddleja alternifolia TaxID=168488 RepID=A0AAV6WQ84_9LAMI|nr:hypothetical protein BUALT_Bualt15G0111800 [Buddleja alternifolia]